MEGLNEGTKLVAQAVELIKDYLEMNDIENEALLLKGIDILQEALVKLTDKM